MKQVRTHTINGRKFDIDVEPALGYCNCPFGTDLTPTIHVTMGINSRKGLCTLVHEILHGENWLETEEVIDRISDDIGGLIWRLVQSGQLGRIK